MPPTTPTPPQGEYPVDPNTHPPVQPGTSVGPQQAQTPSQPAPSFQPGPAPAPAPQPYDFIINPEPAPKKPILPGGGSKVVRIGVVLGGLLVLFVLFSIIKSFLGADSNTPSLLKVTQAQQGIIHITKGSATENSISDSNSNFAMTANLSVSSSQSKLIAYMAKNGKKVKPKELALGVDLQTDKQLLAASAANTYNPTFNQIMKSTIKDYMSDLKIAYSKTTGLKGKALLQDDYNQASLLLKQLDN